MASSQRIDRKAFLTWALSSTSAVALGCSDAGADAPATGGAGGMLTAGGTAGSGAGGTFAGSAGTFSNAGTAGTFSSSGAGAGGVGGAGGASGVGGASMGGGGAAAMPNCSTQLKVLITADHGHTLEIAMADVMAGAPKAYDTKGKSNHSHWIQLTSADFAKLQSGGTVRKLSCNDGHEHEFIVNCVGVEKPETTSGIPGFCDAEHKCGEAMGNFCPDPT